VVAYTEHGNICECGGELLGDAACFADTALSGVPLFHLDAHSWRLRDNVLLAALPLQRWWTTHASTGSMKENGDTSPFRAASVLSARTPYYMLSRHLKPGLSVVLADARRRARRVTACVWFSAAFGGRSPACSARSPCACPSLSGRGASVLSERIRCRRPAGISDTDYLSPATNENVRQTLE